MVLLLETLVLGWNVSILRSFGVLDCDHRVFLLHLAQCFMPFLTSARAQPVRWQELLEPLATLWRNRESPIPTPLSSLTLFTVPNHWLPWRCSKWAPDARHPSKAEKSWVIASHRPVPLSFFCLSSELYIYSWKSTPLCSFAHKPGFYNDVSPAPLSLSIAWFPKAFVTAQLCFLKWGFQRQTDKTGYQNVAKLDQVYEGILCHCCCRRWKTQSVLSQIYHTRVHRQHV